MTESAPPKPGLLERLDGDGVICAEGFLFEMERRGYMQAGGFVPEVVLEHPEALAQFHRELVRAGSDVVQAFTYYAHREKLRLIGKEEQLEPLNHAALDLARSVADEFPDNPPLVAANLSQSNVYRGDGSTSPLVRSMFDEQVDWAAQHRPDLVIGETYYFLGEARLALSVIKDAGLPAVITLALPASGTLSDGYQVAEAARILEQEGADVVGLNCFRGPATTLPYVREIRQAVSCHVAALPVPYRTTPEEPTFFALTDAGCSLVPDGRPFPVALDPLLCNRYELAEFAREAWDLGARYIGICCGNSPAHTRSVAEALGRRPVASQYSPDMSKHFAFGTDPTLDEQTLNLSSTL